MTEEQIKQKAEEYIKNKICKDCADEGFCEGECLQSKYKKQGYLAGYHEGFKDCAKARLNTTTISDCPIKDEWHDLRKDPTDLPPKMVSNPNFSIEVLSDKGEIVNYNFHFCEWYYWRSGKPIAWCEIPKWKESE